MRIHEVLDLAEAVGTVEALLIGSDEAESTFDAAAMRDPQHRARFEYLSGLHVDLREGRVGAANEKFERALETVNGDRSLRSLIQLALARGARESGDHSFAAWAYGEVIARPTRSLVPFAIQGLASLELVRERVDVAERLGLRALEEFQAVDNRHGVLTSRSHLAAVALARGDADHARRELQDVVADRRETCDVVRLPKSLNNLAVACERLEDWNAARHALLEAMRLNRDLGRERMLAANFNNLGSCLEKSGEPMAALAAYEESVRLARGVGAFDRELCSLHAMMGLVTRRAAASPSRELVGALVDRGHQILRARPESLKRESILEFSLEAANAFEAGLVGGVSARVDLRTSDWVPSRGRRRLTALTAFESAPGIMNRLRAQVDDALAMRGAPDVGNVSAFLELFLGDFLKNSDYASEFAVSHHTAKRHLKALCGSGVLALTGTRKAARYAVALLH
jgi:tetratricopeptide (TPR) repeat protein